MADLWSKARREGRHYDRRDVTTIDVSDTLVRSAGLQASPREKNEHEHDHEQEMAAALGGSMTKAELVEEVSRVSDLTKKHSEVIVDTVFRSIITALHRGEKIELRGFGSFRLRRREPRKGRNPKTGDKVDVPPKKVPYFKPGKELKELINQEPPQV